MQISYCPTLILISVLAMVFPFIAAAQTSLERIRAALSLRLNNSAIVDAITQSPLPGLFEVREGGDVMYWDETGTFILQGNLVNLQTGQKLMR